MRKFSPTFSNKLNYKSPHTAALQVAKGKRCNFCGASFEQPKQAKLNALAQFERERERESVSVVRAIAVA